jgi:hypothetical protein
MIDLLQEQRLSLTQLARHEGVSVSTVWRWARCGVRGAVLESFNVGGRKFTTREAFRRFVERTTAAVSAESARALTNNQRDAAIRRAEAQLDEAGA